MDNNETLLAAVSEIRDLVRLLAEPAVAERDKQLRADLRRAVGNSVPRSKAAFLLDGTRTQADVHRETGIHKGDLSSFVKKLSESRLLTGDVKSPKLVLNLPSGFFENELDDDR